MSGNINLRNLVLRSRGKIRHHVALNRQYLPILFRCPVLDCRGLPLTENGPQPEYVGLISGRRASARDFRVEQFGDGIDDLAVTIAIRAMASS
jgi:hypothetical protein